MAHRLLICAGLSAGTSVISNVDLSEDILATLDCLRALGAKVTCKDSRVIISGIDPAELSHPASLPCRECGSTLRFMIPVCLLSGQEIRLTGSRTLFTRPLDIYQDICREQMLYFEKNENSLAVAGKLSAGQYVLPGNVSSQFVTGLLLALPLLEGDSTIRLLPPIESRPYIDMTLHALSLFGIKARTVPGVPFLIHVPGGQRYMPRDLKVEGDYSNAAFFEALNLLGGDVQVEGLDENSLQGDKIFRDCFARLREGFADVDLSDCPDLGPVLMAVAAALHGGRFTGTKRLKYKESDRGAAMKQELGRMNVRVDLSENEILVHPGIRRPQEILDGHNDHRIVMALAVLLAGRNLLLAGPIKQDPKAIRPALEAVTKSLPDFFNIMSGLGIKISFEQSQNKQSRNRSDER